MQKEGPQDIEGVGSSLKLSRSSSAETLLSKASLGVQPVPIVIDLMD